MPITRTDVDKVSLLARLQLTDAELETMAMELGQIVAYVDQLAEVDTTAVQHLSHAAEVNNVFAADHVQPCLKREQALLNAPRCNQQSYLVPPVMGR